MGRNGAGVYPIECRPGAASIGPCKVREYIVRPGYWQVDPGPEPLLPRRVTPHDDEVLIARILKGDSERYELLVHRYQGQLFRYAVGMVRDTDIAADLVQDTFVRAYARLSTCQNPARFGAWIFRILVNRCKDHLKSRHRNHISLDDETLFVPERESPLLHTGAGSLGQAITRALATLPAAQREAFLLKHVEECSYEEMAELLGVAVSALKMRVMRARVALQALLRELKE